jgi:hypothetical protein
MATFSTATERAALGGFLDQQRDALIRKVRGVGDADARRAPTASELSLLGILRHSAMWEERWFQGVVAGRALPDGWPEHQEPIAHDFFVGDEDTVDHWIARYEAAAEVSRTICSGRDLDDRCALSHLVDENVRWVMLHMIEETARHAGHADIIRETIDGSQGL